MTTMRRVALLLLLLTCVGAPAALAQEVRYYREGDRMVHEFSGSVAVIGAEVRVESDLGSVRVGSGPDPAVHYRIRVTASLDEGEAMARRRLDAFVISASRDGDVLQFRGEAATPDDPGGLSAEFDLTVPRATRQVDVMTGAGDLDLGGVDGRAVLFTRGGRISVGEIGGPLEAETSTGDIDIGQVRGAVRLITSGGSVRIESAEGDLEARTSGGDLHIGRVAGQVRAETGGGSVRVDTSSRDVVAVANGGNIDLGRIEGHVSAATAGGSIRVGSAGRGARCETASGPIVLSDVEGPLQARTSAGNIRAVIRSGPRDFSESDLRTLRGDIVVLLPESLPMTIRALVDNPWGAGIRSDFPLTIVREAEDVGQLLEMAEGDIGGGGSVLKIRALGGNIVILKGEGPRPGARP